MAVDPAVLVASIGAWASIMSVAVKGALDARSAKHQTNGPLTEISTRIARMEERSASTEERTARTEERIIRVERYLAQQQQRTRRLK